MFVIKDNDCLSLVTKDRFTWFEEGEEEDGPRCQYLHFEPLELDPGSYLLSAFGNLENRNS